MPADREPREPAPWQRPWWLAFLDRTNLTVTALTAAFVVYTRAAAAAYFGVGALACVATAKLLKRVVRQPRPPRNTRRKSTYGMPSTHAATITYYAVFIPLACARRAPHASLPAAAALAPLVVVPWAALIAASRVWLGHHTWAQVAAGTAVGAAFAAGWFALWAGGVDQYGLAAERAVDAYFGWR